MTSRMSGAEIINAIKSDTLPNRARRGFSNWTGRIEQAGQQRNPITPIEMRRMEFDAVRAIAAVLSVQYAEFP